MVAVSLLSIVGGVALTPVLFLPFALYLLGNLGGSMVIGKSWSDRIILPSVLATMHFAWGIGYLTSPKNLVK
jgi:hypothetical protein